MYAVRVHALYQQACYKQFPCLCISSIITIFAGVQYCIEEISHDFLNHLTAWRKESEVPE